VLWFATVAFPRSLLTTMVMAMAGPCALVAALAVAPDVPQQPPGSERPAPPLADHHQHLFSPDVTALLAVTPPLLQARPRTATDLMAQLDAAGIARAVVLSAAYIFEQPSRKVDAAGEKVRRENDWTSQQVARFPDRLVGFCGINPLKDYAVDELLRCARDPYLRHGVKLHFGNSVVDFHNPTHIEQVRRVFRAANDHRMAIVVHLRASVTQGMAYGPDEARVFLDEWLPAAPDVVVQVAHLGGAGPWQDEGVRQAFVVLVEAVARRDPRTRLLYVDATALGSPATQADAEWWAGMIRRLGPERVLFGSDATLPAVTPGDAWIALRKLLPLTADEFAVIAGNVPPYLR
jgi:predicted TIM-barrel fold metal-dependent hydrolase